MHRQSTATRVTQEGARHVGLRPRRGLPARPGSRGRRLPRGPSDARSAPRAVPRRRRGERRARAQREEAANGGGGRKSETAQTRGRGPKSARSARSPRARRASHSDARAKGPSRASPWTWRHTDAWRRGGSLHRAQRKARQTADERRDDSHHTHAASPARLRRREPPDRPTHTGARARAARASPVAMRAGNGLAPRGAASEEKPRDDDDADRRRV